MKSSGGCGLQALLPKILPHTPIKPRIPSLAI
nr:MAG TPA: hypothetical protein [Caudoviricetes sp.]